MSTLQRREHLKNIYADVTIFTMSPYVKKDQMSCLIHFYTILISYKVVFHLQKHNGWILHFKAVLRR